MNTKSTYWQLSTLGVGLIAEGLEDLRQCIDLILRTRKGTDPLRPLFGSEVFAWIDKPVTQAIPNIKKAIIESVGIWEKRVQVVKITHEINEKYLAFQITYRPVDQDLLDSISLYIGNGFMNALPGDSGYLILTAFIPKNVPANKQYKIDFTCKGTQIPPYAPVAGFNNVDVLYMWVQENWRTYGTWFRTADRLILYMKKGICEQPALNITIAAFYTFTDEFILPGPGNYYTVTFLPNNLQPDILFPENEISTREELLTWVGNNWGAYGSWSLEGDKLVLMTDLFTDAVLVVHTSDTPLLYFDDDIVLLDSDYVLIKQ